MRIKIFFALVLLPTVLAAGPYTSTGAGGGGCLHSGAILPTDSNTMVIGSDVAGIYVTRNFASTWKTWNDGLWGSDRLFTQHVEDLLGIDYGSRTGFLAATQGGIYYADENGDWESTTPLDDYYYERTSGDFHEGPPFSCLDWRGADLVVAGAGRIWWTSSYSASEAYEDDAYPGLSSINEYGDSLNDGQWTVWTADLDDNTLRWKADQESDFGPARDISFTVRNDTTYIVVATADAIHLKTPTGWSTVFDSTDFGDSLTCWTLHLTDRGTLYAAMRKKAPSCPHPFGVYRIFDIGNPTDWTWVGDDADLPPDSKSVKDYGVLYHQLVQLSVVNGQASDGDVLYLATRNSSAGIFRGLQPYHEDSLCHWQHKIFGGGDSLTYYDNDGDEQYVDQGWHTGSAALIFPAVVSDYFPDVVLAHFGGRLHITGDSMDTWQQCYTTEVGTDYWLTKGYKELCVTDVAFMSDGRAVESTGDHGLFRSSDGDLDEWDYLEVPAGTATPTNDIPYMAETENLAIWPDWRGSGEDAILFVSGDRGHKPSPFKLFWIDENDDWHNLTGDLSNPERYVFYDFVFTGTDSCFVSYAKYDDEVGSGYDDLLDFGVVRGTYDTLSCEWTWSDWNDGLTARSDPTSNAPGVAFLYHEDSGRIFLGARQTNALFSGESEAVSVPGGLYMLESPTDTDWELIFGGEGSEWQDVRCLAESFDGEVVYAGTRGCPCSMVGTVFKCTNPDSTPTTWTALANTPTAGYPFGWATPAGKQWSEESSNKWLTVVEALAVDPRDANTIYAGLTRIGFRDQEGVWKYDGSSWTHMSANTAFEGVGVGALATSDATVDSMLLIGTEGLELYFRELGHPNQHQIKFAANARLKDLNVRSEMGGRTEIEFALDQPSKVSMQIFDVRGRLIHRRDAEFKKAGRCTLFWNGSAQSGRPCAPGIYFLRLSTTDMRAHKKFLLIR
jgi:hypothetical protein